MNSRNCSSIYYIQVFQVSYRLPDILTVNVPDTLTLFDLFKFVTEREGERELCILISELNNEVLFFFLLQYCKIKHYSWLKEI